MKKIYLILISILSFHYVLANDTTPTQVADYGDVYLMEERTEDKSKWAARLSYSFELSNPYINVHGVNASVMHRFSKYLQVGGKYIKYFNTRSELTQVIEERLLTNSITQSVFGPSDSAYALFGITPLSGRLNLFSATSMPFELSLYAGAGATRYMNNLTLDSYTWSAQVDGFFTDHLGLFTSVGQQIESLLSKPSTIARFEIQVGMAYKF